MIFSFSPCPERGHPSIETIPQVEHHSRVSEWLFLTLDLSWSPFDRNDIGRWFNKSSSRRGNPALPGNLRRRTQPQDADTWTEKEAESEAANERDGTAQIIWQGLRKATEEVEGFKRWQFEKGNEFSEPGKLKLVQSLLGGRKEKKTFFITRIEPR